MSGRYRRAAYLGALAVVLVVWVVVGDFRPVDAPYVGF